ncbi:hypothetical protein Purlil1_7613 [Purpureocillium lilacinum]|uniref:DNA sliding clamp PCNA n=1 Tax=Purpureocillium lilacinum TaxID=33203 RepID=A0ABR0BVL9_PURLI|nr:hypothetical protein Purlil1_7613 [Purpureocillium lilacinum]
MSGADGAPPPNGRVCPRLQVLAAPAPPLCTPHCTAWETRLASPNIAAGLCPARKVGVTGSSLTPPRRVWPPTASRARALSASELSLPPAHCTHAPAQTPQTHLGSLPSNSFSVNLCAVTFLPPSHISARDCPLSVSRTVTALSPHAPLLSPRCLPNASRCVPDATRQFPRAPRADPRQVVDAIKDLVQDCNFDCNDSGIALQAMDNSHVALVSMMLKAEGFSPYRCDRNIALGVNLTSLTKVLRAAQNEDILTLKAEDAPDVLNLVFESSENDRISEYDLKLMDIDQEHLGIPQTEYAATIAMPASEFRRICTDLAAMSESVNIEASKDGVKFSCNGDIGNGSVTLRSHTNVEKPELNVDIELTEPVTLTFSLKYLVNFCKAAALSNQVKICLSSEVPLLVEYNLSGSSYLRFYLAPKIGDED